MQPPCSRPWRSWKGQQLFCVSVSCTTARMHAKPRWCDVAQLVELFSAYSDGIGEAALLEYKYKYNRGRKTKDKRAIWYHLNNAPALGCDYVAAIKYNRSLLSIVPLFVFFLGVRTLDWTLGFRLLFASVYCVLRTLVLGALWDSHLQAI